MQLPVRTAHQQPAIHRRSRIRLSAHSLDDVAVHVRCAPSEDAAYSHGCNTPSAAKLNNSAIGSIAGPPSNIPSRNQPAGNGVINAPRLMARKAQGSAALTALGILKGDQLALVLSYDAFLIAAADAR